MDCSSSSNLNTLGIQTDHRSQRRFSRPTREWLAAHNVCADRSCVRVTVLCVAIAVVWAVLAVPSVLFYLPQELREDTLVVVNSSNSCDKAEVYEGSICRDSLLTQRSNLEGSQDCGPIYIPSTNGRQEDLERDAIQVLVSGLQLLSPSPDCEEEVVPLVCLYLFRLCDDNRTLHQPSSQQCEAVRDGACQSEWRTADMFLTTSTLPDCSTLPDIECTLDCQNGTERSVSDCEEMKDSSRDSLNTTNSSNNTTLVCREDFYSFDGVCKPICGKWRVFSDSAIMTTDVFKLLATTIDIVMCTIILAMVCKQHKRLLKFPTSLIVYQTGVLLVFAVIILIGYGGRKDLFCSAKGWKESLDNPSAFCTITGVAFVYVVYLLMGWWLCHGLVMFWAIKFPFQANSYSRSDSTKYVHVTVVILGFLLPLPPVGAVLATEGFMPLRATPTVCLPASVDAAFYSMVLPVSIVLATGISLIVLVLDEIVKSLQSRRKAQVVQGKILIVLCYFVIFGALNLTVFSINIRNSPQFRRELFDYFLCESKGVVPGETCDTSRFRKFSNPIPSALSFIVLSLLPVANLMFIVRVQDIRAAWSFCKKCISSLPFGTRNDALSHRTP